MEHATPLNQPPRQPGHAPSWRTMARLLRAIELLSQPGGTHTQELAAELGLKNERDVKRTVLEALHSLGLRIEYPDEGSPGVAHRYRLDREAVKSVRIGIPNSRQILLEPLLETDEWMLLSFLLNSGGILGSRPEVQPVLNRLRSKLSQALQDSSLNDQGRRLMALFQRLDPVFEYLDQKPKHYPEDIWERVINPLVEATAAQRVCAVSYASLHAGATKDMDILPLRLVENQGSLYLLSLSAKYRNTVLPLEIGRFRGVNVTDQEFELPDIDLDGILASSFSIFIDEPQLYRIRFSAVAAPHVLERQWAADQELERQDDGSLVISMKTAGYPDVRRWVLGWGKEATVLAPAALRRDIRETLEASLAQYRDAASEA